MAFRFNYRKAFFLKIQKNVNSICPLGPALKRIIRPLANSPHRPLVVQPLVLCMFNRQGREVPQR